MLLLNVFFLPFLRFHSTSTNMDKTSEEDTSRLCNNMDMTEEDSCNINPPDQARPASEPVMTLDKGLAEICLCPTKLLLRQPKDNGSYTHQDHRRRSRQKP
jgi:hypothetical protein